MTGITFEQPTIAVADRADVYYIAKRALDFVVATTLLTVLAPVLLLIAVLIKLDTPGPVIFSQERVGSRRVRHGKPAWELRTFRLYKFRSMVRNASSSLHEAHVKAFVEGRVTGDDPRSRFKLQNDPRVTRVGAFLRRTSLDELPQLVNVVRGDMSLVGPRPVPLYEVSHYRNEHRERFAAVPGITGLWQISGRCSLPFEEMFRLDVEYVRNQSLRLDLKILALTIPAVLSTRGAG